MIITPKQARQKRKLETRKLQKMQLRAGGVMLAAKKQLARYCRAENIDDAECQRIADRINYERDQKNHLKNKATEKLKLERSKATDAEFARLQQRLECECEIASEETLWPRVRWFARVMSSAPLGVGVDTFGFLFTDKTSA